MTLIPLKKRMLTLAVMGMMMLVQGNVDACTVHVRVQGNGNKITVTNGHGNGSGNNNGSARGNGNGSGNNNGKNNGNSSGGKSGAKGGGNTKEGDSKSGKP